VACGMQTDVEREYGHQCAASRVTSSKWRHKLGHINIHCKPITL